MHTFMNHVENHDISGGPAEYGCFLTVYTRPFSESLSVDIDIMDVTKDGKNNNSATVLH